MTRATYLAVALALAACQAGEPTPPRGAPPAAAKVVTPTSAPVTPMWIASEAPPAVTDAAAPFTLTASDGSGLALRRIDAKAVVQGPLAFTELHLYFHNPEARTREGTFTITLPSGAAVSRFAMEIDGQFQEAEVVEKAVARRVYDDFLHRRQDPALLEKAAGNQFSAKVFPIPANADKHLVVSFSQELPGRGYVLPLRGLPKTDRVDVMLTATRIDGTQHPQSLNKRDWQPDQDFVASLPASPTAVAAGGVVASAIAIQARGGTAAPVRELTLLVDTSASRALGFARYVTAIHELVDALRARYGDALALQVVAFDQDTETIYDGTVADYGAAADQALRARGAYGASNLGQAMASLAAPKRRVVIVTDGVVTAGPDTPALVDAVRKLPIDRVDVVLAGGIRDEQLAAAVARAGLPQAGDVLDLDRGIAAVATGLGEPVLVDVAIEVPGATWVYPKTIVAARPGSARMVFARMAKPAQAIDVIVGGARTTLGLASATPALVERAVAAAEIEELETKLALTADPAAAQPLRDDIAKRSVRARVISSQTSMLVLETEADYARYKLERTALADILVIGPQGLEQRQRATFLASAAPKPPARHDAAIAGNARAEAIEAARSAGILGSVSTTDGGAFASLTGEGEVSSGFDDTTVMGGLVGNEAGEMQGGFGFGRSGFGPGGGGTGTIGTGRFGTIGHGAGTGSGYGIGGGRGGMRGRSSTAPAVRIGQPTVEGDLDRAIIRRYLRRHLANLAYCYERELLTKPRIAGTLTAQFVIDSTGRVSSSTASGLDEVVARCVADVIKTIQFPAARGGGNVRVSYPLVFQREEARAPAPAPRGGGWTDDAPTREEEENRGGPALTGKLADVMKAVRTRNADKAVALATAWQGEAPGDVLALIALGEALEAKHQMAKAARVYGSIIDLFPTRADMRRFAGERLERIGATTRKLVVDTYRRAVADRPDHATGHRLLAYALVREDDYAGAFAAILAGVDQKYPSGRFAGADRVLAEDAAMIGAAYVAHGGKPEAVRAELDKRGLSLATEPSTRFIMYWETDANDVDFHIRDSRGGHAWYSSPELPSGGELYADVTTGYGPECFAISGTPKAGPYRLSINYFSQGPMGYGMGLLQIQRFDGKGFSFEDRPYVIMTDHAFVDLGTYR